MSHTPGPWTLLVDHHRTDRRRRMALVSTPNARMSIDCTDSGATYRDDCDNARLIAAAPDLLAALKVARDVLTSTRYEFNSDFEIAMKLVHQSDAAIAKAEGR